MADNINISQLLDRLNRLIDNITTTVQERIQIINDSIENALKDIGVLREAGLGDVARNLNSTVQRIREGYIDYLNNFSNQLRQFGEQIRTGQVDVRNISGVRDTLNYFNEEIGKHILNSVDNIRFYIESTIRSLTGAEVGIPIEDVIESVRRGEIQLNNQARERILKLADLYRNLGNIESVIGAFDIDTDIVNLRRELGTLFRLGRTGELQRYFQNIQSIQLQSDVPLYSEFSISGLMNAIENILSEGNTINRLVNEYLNRNFKSLEGIFDDVKNTIDRLIQGEQAVGELAIVQGDIDTQYISQLGMDATANLEQLLGERFLRRSLSDRLREQVRQLSTLATQEIQRYSQTFGRLGEILTPILDLQPFDVALGGEMGLDFANGIRRVNTLFGNMSVMLSQQLGSIISGIEKGLEQAFTREPFLYTEKFIEEAQQNMNRLNTQIRDRIEQLASLMSIDIRGIDISTPEGMSEAYRRIREEAVRRIQLGGDVREFMPVVELGSMISTYRGLQEQIPEAHRVLQYMQFPELMSSFDRFRFGFLQPLQEGLSQLGNFTIGSLSWIAMFGLSNAFFLASTMLPMEQSYRAFIPMYQALGGLFGFTQLFDRLQDFTYWLPWNMENLAMQYTTLSGLMGTPQLAQRMLQTALEISRVEPIQFEEAMTVITALSVTPQIRYAMQRPEFQRDIFNAVQLLSILVPEQGIEGAIFSVREFLNNQFLSIQRRFNIEIEAIASYGGVTVDEIRSADPVRKIQILARALENLFGGNEELLLMRGATLMTQVNNVIDTLNNSLIRPLITLRSPQIDRFLTDLLESGTLRRIAPQFYERATEISQRTGLPMEQIVSDIYGTPYGLLALTMTGINTFIGQVFESLNIGQVLGRMFMNISRDLISIMDSYLSIEQPSVPITRYYGQLLLNTISNTVRETLSNTQLGDVINLISSFVGDVMSSTFRNLTVGILKASVSALTEIPNVVAQTTNEAVFGTVFSLGNTIRASLEPFVNVFSTLFDTLENTGRILSGRSLDEGIVSFEQIRESLTRFTTSLSSLFTGTVQSVGDIGQVISTLATFTMPVYALRTRGLGGATMEFLRFSQLALGMESLSQLNIGDAIQGILGFQLFGNIQNLRFAGMDRLRRVFEDLFDNIAVSIRDLRFRELGQTLVGAIPQLGIPHIWREIRFPLGMMLGVEAVQTQDWTYALSGGLLMYPQLLRDVYRYTIAEPFRTLGFRNLLQLGTIAGLGIGGLEVLEGMLGRDYSTFIDVGQGLITGYLLNQLLGSGIQDISRRIVESLGLAPSMIQRFTNIFRTGLFALPVVASTMEDESLLGNILGYGTLGLSLGAFFGLPAMALGTLVGAGVGIWQYVSRQNEIENSMRNFINEYNRNISQMYAQMFTNILSQVPIYFQETGITGTEVTQSRAVLTILGTNLVNAIRDYARGRFTSVLQNINEAFNNVEVSDIQTISQELLDSGDRIDQRDVRNLLVSAISEQLMSQGGVSPDTAQTLSNYIVSYFGDLPRLFTNAIDQSLQIVGSTVGFERIDRDRFTQFVEDVIKGNVRIDDIIQSIQQGGEEAIRTMSDIGIREPMRVDRYDVVNMLTQMNQRLQDDMQMFQEISSSVYDVMGRTFEQSAWGFIQRFVGVPQLPELPADITQIGQTIQEWAGEFNRVMRSSPFSASSLAQTLAYITSATIDDAGRIRVDREAFTSEYLSRMEELWSVVSQAPTEVLARYPSLLTMFSRAYVMGANLSGYESALREAFELQIQNIQAVVSYPEAVSTELSTRAIRIRDEQIKLDQPTQQVDVQNILIKAPNVNIVVNDEEEEV